MQISDTIGDMIARLRNGQMAKKDAIKVPFSKEKMAILKVLKDEGFINNFSDVELRKGVKDIIVELKYFRGEGAIKEIKRVSKPGLRAYTKCDDIPQVCNGLGVAIVSTSKGVMADYSAREDNLGGEIICTVF